MIYLNFLKRNLILYHVLAKLVYDVFSENSKGKNNNNIEENLAATDPSKDSTEKCNPWDPRGSVDKVFLSRKLTKFYFLFDLLLLQFKKTIQKYLKIYFRYILSFLKYLSLSQSICPINKSPVLFEIMPNLDPWINQIESNHSITRQTEIESGKFGNHCCLLGMNTKK
jgi:hypothetical protein